MSKSIGDEAGIDLSIDATTGRPEGAPAPKPPKHNRQGNCWGGNTRTDVCNWHDEPRGECSACLRCPRCDEEARQLEE